jgi:hypothetical protein
MNSPGKLQPSAVGPAFSGHVGSAWSAPQDAMISLVLATKATVSTMTSASRHEQRS